MTTTLYGISNCDTVKKAQKWLLQNNISYTFHDFRKDGLDKRLIDSFLENLSWSDFQGVVDPNTFGRAKTSYKIDIIPENVKVDEQDRIQGFEALTVDARFYKKQSWTTVPINDTIVLGHEQIHFHIAEIFARKIRKKFINLQKNKEARFAVYSESYR